MNGRTVRVQRPGMQRAMAAVTAAVVVVALSVAFRSIETSRAPSNVGPTHVASSVGAPPAGAASRPASHPVAHGGPVPHSLKIQAATKYEAQIARRAGHR
jgi:hypothetical protein